MATYAYAEPAIYMPGSNKEPDISILPATPAAGIKRGDFVTLAAGLLTRPTGVVGTGSTSTAFVGLTAMDQTATYFSGIGGSAAVITPQAANATLFGATTASTVLQPGVQFTGTMVQLAHDGQQFEVSLSTASNAGAGWATSLIGTQVGIALDGASNLYIADTTATNKCAVITGSIDGPNKGTVGDLGKRVTIQFLNANIVF